MPKKYERTANFIDVETGEVFSAKRGTKQYEKYKAKGYLTREQVSHRKEYQPDIIEPPEDTYTDVDEKELLLDRVSVMYDVIFGKVEDIPNERYFHQTHSYVDFTEEKQKLFNAIDDFYADLDNPITFDKYIDDNMPGIEGLIDIIKHDSDQYVVFNAFTQLLTLLQGGTLSNAMSKLLGDLGDWQGSYSGWYEKSSRYSDTFSRTIWKIYNKEKCT